MNSMRASTFLSNLWTPLPADAQNMTALSYELHEHFLIKELDFR
jgi:hypothetical protein